ncbi:uncharacterized protein LOC131462135 [Solea solea]|uniref:uncharacterized protein LOC131462135 n=1 Tax=Solea solea TaxID=90069 RepID=UPI00272A4ECD|nr:uncharacterized protein LOC131462135 [Solea solea]
MQNQESSPRPGVTAAHLSQKPVLPQISYHPTIKAQNPRKGVVPKTSKPPETHQPVSQHGDNSTQVNLDPATRPKTQRVQKPVQRGNSDPDRHSDSAPPTPAQVPLGLKVPLEKSVVQQVEVLTRGQRNNQDWFSWRKNRITASVAHRIAHCRFVNGKSRTPPTSYLAAITGDSNHVQTRAMSWGVNMEAVAIDSYQKLKTTALGQPISVQDCGLFIDGQRPWLAASPDGIVTDSTTGQWLLCLEVKCPYKHREGGVEEACQDSGFCLEIEDRQMPGESPAYRLKTSHSYYTQIQCQLAVTGLQRADLVVYTTKETAIVPVTFDAEMWAETVSKLEIFYRDAVLPRLRETSAAWSPEQ